MTNILKALSICAVALPALMLATPAKAEMTGDQIKAAVSGILGMTAATRSPARPWILPENTTES